MGKSGFPDNIYTQRPSVIGPWVDGVYILGKPQVPMLQARVNAKIKIFREDY